MIGGAYLGQVYPGGQYYAPAGGTAYTLTAATGTFTLAGQNAALPLARVLPSAAGAVTITGQSAALPIARVVTASPGSYTVTGIAATLTAQSPGSLTITAGTGTFSVNGIDATPAIARIATAETGSFTLSGLTVDWIFHREESGGQQPSTYPWSVSAGAFRIEAGPSPTFTRRRPNGEIYPALQGRPQGNARSRITRILLHRAPR